VATVGCAPPLKLSEGIQQETDSQPMWLYLLFFMSGIPAILYQIVWQRALFSLFGINIESVTIVVSAFMLGLGLGSLGGGTLSKSKRLPPVALFGVAELGIAIFALASLSIFHSVAEFTRARPLWVTGSISFLLVIIPTTLMGSTLPLLIEHLVRRSRNVGSSVGALYFVNTLGSGAACIVAVRPLMSSFGQAGTVRCGALLNGLVGLSALVYSFRSARRDSSEAEIVANEAAVEAGPLLPFSLALLCAGFCGFAALSYEIVWYRLLAFALNDTAPTFAFVLGSYLIGLAMGSRFAEGYAERHSVQNAIRILPLMILASALVSFWVNPLAARVLGVNWIVHSPGGVLVWFLSLALICHAAILFGVLFPLIAHAAVGSRGNAGTAVSYLYTANIIGSTTGVLLVGFVLMDKFSLYRIAWLLLIAGVLCAAVVFSVTIKTSAPWRLPFAIACIVAVFTAPASRPIFATMYDRLLFKTPYPMRQFSEVIENRSGMIGVTADGTVFGGGIYDGQFKVDLINDANMIVRPFALSAFHSNPARVLMIGLGSGSWAQVIVNNPQVRHLTVVDINSGYLEAIAKHAVTASLLSNPKITIAIDDGRRWLLQHPEEKFDVIVMNCTFYWRNHSSNLLSADFLRITRPHLSHGGVLFYNTTWSDDVMATGVAVYPYALRFFNCLTLSDSPITFDAARWRSILLNYSIDGSRIINPQDAAQMKRLDEIVNISHAAPLVAGNSIEDNDEIRQRLKGQQTLIITDDNMGLEWR
jgi:spermidine synthase